MSLYQRVHYFTVQTCKRVFRHPDYGIVRFDDMIANADEYGFEVVYVAGISLENLPLYYRHFFIPESMFSATGFLCDFWSRSYSNKYVVSHKLLQRDRTPVAISLQVFHATRLQIFLLRCSFDTFRNNADIQTFSQCNDVIHNMS